MPVPQLPPWGTPTIPYNQIPNQPWGTPQGGGLPYNQIPNQGPWGTPIPQGNPEMPQTPPTQPPATPPANQYSWNPFGTYNSQWNNPIAQNQGYNASWHPDFGETGATGFYQGLLNDEDGTYTNQYTQMLANAVMSGGYFNPYAQDIYHNTLAPTVGYGFEDQMAGAYNDNTAQQYNSQDYWNSLENSLGQYMNTAFGGGFGDQTAGNNDRVEQMNDWLQDVIGTGRQYASNDPSQYYSTARRRDRDRAWQLLEGRAQAMGLDEEFYNLGSNIFNQGMGSNASDYNPMSTGGFGNYLGRRRNQAYS